MSLYIKKFFIKELEDIVAPLEKIKSNISAHIEKIEIKIEKDSTKVKELIDTNAKRAESNLKASTIFKNLETLLGA